MNGGSIVDSCVDYVLVAMYSGICMHCVCVNMMYVLCLYGYVYVLYACEYVVFVCSNTWYDTCNNLLIHQICTMTSPLFFRDFFLQTVQAIRYYTGTYSHRLCTTITRTAG